jgi:tRNA1Val (adenine37-N6)-methyltransferase
MKPVLKTNDPVLLSFARDLLAQAGIDSVVFDENASVMDGSLGILPRRLMVADEDVAHGEALLRDGLARQAQPPQTMADRFLDGRVVVVQPKDGFRSGLDAVMLAAAVPAHNGDAVLELGSGAGAASLCLAARIDGVRVTGAEIDGDLAGLANRNAAANGFTDRVAFATADVLDLPSDLRRDHDHVFCNPPFHDTDGAVPSDAARARALHDGGDLAAWLSIGLKRTVTSGSFTVILRADRLGEALAALPPTGLRVFPLWPRDGEPAKRVILQVRKASRAPLQLLPGLVLHAADGSYTSAADAILREGRGLSL